MRPIDNRMSALVISGRFLRLFFWKYSFSVKDASDRFDIKHREEVIGEERFPTADGTAEQYVFDFTGDKEE